MKRRMLHAHREVGPLDVGRADVRRSSGWPVRSDRLRHRCTLPGCSGLVRLGSLAVQLHELRIVDIDAEGFLDGASGRPCGRRS